MPFSNVPTTEVVIPVSEQDYFYWPCMSGEKYAPTLTAGSGSITYSSLDLYPTITGSAAAGPTSPTATYPVAPSWKYSQTAFAGYTLSFRINIGASTTIGNGCKFRFNSSGAVGSDYIQFLRGSAIDARFAGVSTNLALTTGNSTWYSVVATVNAAGQVTIVINGTTYLTNTAATLNILALQPLFIINRASGAGTAEGNLTQMQVTYA